MNNFMISAKRFITNKNTVTIIGVLVVLIILYWGYKSTIDNAVQPVNVPVAAHLIPPQTEVTSADISWRSVPSIAKENNVLTSESQIVGKYTGVNATIPAGSMFYNDVLVTKDQLPGDWLTKIKSDANGIPEIPYYLATNPLASFGNAITPESYVDIYMKANDENGLVMIGKLIENLQIIEVVDGNMEDVFESVDSNRTPAYLFFSLPSDLHILMRKAQQLGNRGVELIVVPHGGPTPIVGDLNVSSAYLRDYIDAYSGNVPLDDDYLGILGGDTSNTNSNESNSNTPAGSNTNN